MDTSSPSKWITMPCHFPLSTSCTVAGTTTLRMSKFEGTWTPQPLTDGSICQMLSFTKNSTEKQALALFQIYTEWLAFQYEWNFLSQFFLPPSDGCELFVVFFLFLSCLLIRNWRNTSIHSMESALSLLLWSSCLAWRNILTKYCDIILWMTTMPSHMLSLNGSSNRSQTRNGEKCWNGIMDFNFVLILILTNKYIQHA